MQKPLILSIKRNSLDDGPGIRSVVFFKGCPLSCRWCHNPESRSAKAEVLFNAERCLGCGDCVEVCPQEAILPGNPGHVDRGLCNLCFACTSVCPAQALENAGRRMEVEEVAEELLRDRLFFKNSGGGVTLSGGEPTLFVDFAARLLRSLKEAGIHTLLETCGYFSSRRFTEAVLPFLDLIYYDLKIIDPELHRIECGRKNGRILNNFRLLQSLAMDSGFNLIPRIPLIPGITDRKENLEGLARFLVSCGVKKAVLLDYNPLWREKLIRLGLNPIQMPTYYDYPAMQEWTSTAKREECMQIFSNYGIDAGTAL